MEEWCQEVGVSLPKLRELSKKEDLHVRVPDAKGNVTVVRLLPCDALRAYRRLPAEMRCDVQSVSPVFQDGAGNRLVFVSYLDHAAWDDRTAWASLDLSPRGERLR